MTGLFYTLNDNATWKAERRDHNRGLQISSPKSRRARYSCINLSYSLLIFHFIWLNRKIGYVYVSKTMKKLSLLAILLFLSPLITSFRADESWTPLLDQQLSHWRTYQSYRHKTTYTGDVPKDEKGNPIPPIGYDKNEAKVFSVMMEGKTPVLRISGEIYGCVFTRQDFENYHLKMKVKWGDKKWEPRLLEPMDSGILYHSQGECGVDYFRSWMLSQEFQMIERSMGDYWCIANSQIDIKAKKQAGKDSLIYSRDGRLYQLGQGAKDRYYFCKAAADYEKPKGEWNEIELICYQDKSLHIVNGHVVMALSNSSWYDGRTARALTKGKIQLQSEAAEVFYKDIYIRSIKSLPAQYKSYFQ